MSLQFIESSYDWKNMNLYDFTYEGNVPKGWETLFEDRKEEIKKISTTTAKDSQFTLYPPLHQVFRAFYALKPEEIRVVILGQDPYHTPGCANGYAFAVNPGRSINPSLRNIFIELKSEGFQPKETGDLTNWVKQGVFLLNSSLSVIRGDPESHVDIWFPFTYKVIEYLSEHGENIAWLLMGNKAQTFAPLIDKERHKIFFTSHPSPYSAARPTSKAPAFLGSNVFVKINDYLEKGYTSPIKW